MLKTTAHRIVRWKWVDDILICEGFGYEVDKTEWSDIDWKKVEKTVFKLQNRIYRASESGDRFAVRRLQKMLIKSWSARLLAVRRVTQDNQGKKTAGVDGVKTLTPKQRLAALGRLKLGTKSKPTGRVWIDKPGTKEKRPLGIPTIEERTKQARVKLALEPEWESREEPNSYGFRPGRSTRDAIVAIYNSIRYKSKFVLDADISKCFDCIDHKALLLKLNTYPSLTRQIRAWLKSGVMDKGTFDQTSQGTPQGGVISPLLANIALHGMEERVKQYAETLKMYTPNGNHVSKINKRRSISLIRYADDFVILHEDLGVVKRCHEIIADWLKEIGLELKPSKTRLTHTLNSSENEKPGFDFLGFHIRQYKARKYNSGQDTFGNLLGYKTLIRPSCKSIKAHVKKMAEVIESHKAAPQEAVIKHLNPIISGWCNYFKTVCSKEIFKGLDSYLYQKLRAWAIRRHPNKNAHEVASKYWHKSRKEGLLGGNNWAFSNKNGLELNRHSNVTVNSDYVKVKGTASPFDGDFIYGPQRLGKHPEIPIRVATLLKIQKGVCPHCGHSFRDGDKMEVDHIIPRAIGGKDEYKNLQLLHRHCHQKKTARDLKEIRKRDLTKTMNKLAQNWEKWEWKWVNDVPVILGSKSDGGTHHKSLVGEEPCEVKVSCTVLKTSGTRESLA
jgi:RNA-directed DNA polymerase